MPDFIASQNSFSKFRFSINFGFGGLLRVGEGIEMLVVPDCFIGLAPIAAILGLGGDWSVLDGLFNETVEWPPGLEMDCLFPAGLMLCLVLKQLDDLHCAPFLRVVHRVLEFAFVFDARVDAFVEEQLGDVRTIIKDSPE